METEPSLTDIILSLLAVVLFFGLLAKGEHGVVLIAIVLELGLDCINKTLKEIKKCHK